MARVNGAWFSMDTEKLAAVQEGMYERYQITADLVFFRLLDQPRPNASAAAMYQEWLDTGRVDDLVFAFGPESTKDMD